MTRRHGMSYIRGMLRRFAFVAISPVVVSSLSGCGKPAPVEAQLVDVTTTGVPTMKVHVTGKSGTFMRCYAGELKCDDFVIGPSGAADLAIPIEVGKKFPDTIKFFSFKSSARAGTPTESALDLKKTPRVVDTTAGAYVSTIGIGRKCDAIGTWGPIETFSMTTEPGAIVEVGGAKLTADSGGTISAPVKAFASKPFAELPLDQTLAGDENTDRGSFTMNVTYADNTKLTATLHLKAGMAKHHVGEWFKGIKKGPLLLPGEAGAKPGAGAHGAYRLSTDKILGSPKTLKDIEYVLQEDDAGTRTFVCRYQSGATATLTMHDMEAKLVERRTGRVAFTHKLTAPQVCDDTVEHKAGTAMPPQTSYPTTGDVESWATKQLGH